MVYLAVEFMTYNNMETLTLKFCICYVHKKDSKEVNIWTNDCCKGGWFWNCTWVATFQQSESVNYRGNWIWIGWWKDMQYEKLLKTSHSFTEQLIAHSLLKGDYGISKIAALPSKMNCNVPMKRICQLLRKLNASRLMERCVIPETIKNCSFLERS